MKKITFLLLAFGLFLANPSTFAQQRAASPASKVEQKVGLTDFTIEYSRPSMKDRTIFAADGLVPFGKLWRTGANAATKITLSDDIRINDQTLAAGSYAILTVPDKMSWKVNFYAYGESGWGSYREKEPALSVSVEPQTIDVTVETFLINFTDLRDNSATLGFVWENTYVGVPIQVK